MWTPPHNADITGKAYDVANKNLESLNDVSNALSIIDFSDFLANKGPYACLAHGRNPDMDALFGLDYQENYTKKMVTDTNLTLYYEIIYDDESVEDLKIITESDWKELPSEQDKKDPLWSEIIQGQRDEMAAGIVHYGSGPGQIPYYHLEDMMKTVKLPKLEYVSPSISDMYYGKSVKGIFFKPDGKGITTEEDLKELGCDIYESNNLNEDDKTD